VKGLYEHLQSDVAQKLEAAQKKQDAALQEAAEQEARLRAELDAMTAARATLSTDLARTRDALAQLQQAHQAQSLVLSAAQAESTGLQQRLGDRAAEVSALNHQLSQTRTQFEHYQEASAAQRSEERQATEQRIARLEQDLAIAHRQGFAQQSAIGGLEAQLARLTADHDALRLAHGDAQSELAQAKADRDRFSYQLGEAVSARDSLAAQLEAVQAAATLSKIGLAAQERETQLLAARLAQAETKTSQLEKERLALLEERASLQVELRQPAVRARSGTSSG
jgi:chromosome segregation ATPase